VTAEVRGICRANLTPAGNIKVAYSRVVHYMVTIGIDLGTTNSAVAYSEGEEAEMIEIDSERTMRSVATFARRISGDQDEVIVGNSAVDYLQTDPDTTVAAVKRHMGDDHPYTFDGEDIEYTPEIISGLILKKIRQEVESEIRGVDEVNEAVITVPARFSEVARSCTEAAARYGYIDDVPLLLPEPSAACVAYKVDEGSEDIERVAVYDLGGGTFDVSIVNIVPDSDGATDYVVEYNEGKQQLGGEDFDQRLQEYLIEEFEAETGVDLDSTEDSHEHKRRVREEAKGVKESLSSSERETATVPYLAGENLEVDVTREKLEELTGDLVDETIDICQEVFDELGFGPSEVDTVLTVGGSTKMPQVQEAVKDYFGQDPAGGVNPDEAVAMGAGEQAEVIDSRPTLPSGDDGDDGSDTDGALPTGGGGITPVVRDDVGFELADGSLEVLIEDGMNLPATGEGTYTTEVDYQESAQIRIFKSEAGETDEAVAENNQHIKTFVLDNIREAEQGVPEIKVRFEMDKSGIVRAEAWDESIEDRVSSETDDELEVERKGGGDGDADGPRDAYAPPTVAEIDDLREDLPPVN
jgi:molecular chaperone DnaK